MRTKWVIAGCVVAASLVAGCERNDNNVSRTKSSTDTYGNVSDRKVDKQTELANKDMIAQDAENQLNRMLDEMHQWMDQSSKIAAENKNVANDYRESRDAMEKAADNARKQLQDLRTSTTATTADMNRKQLDNALADLRKKIDDGKARMATSAATGGKVNNPEKLNNNINTTTPAPAPSSSSPTPTTQPSTQTDNK